MLSRLPLLIPASVSATPLPNPDPEEFNLKFIGGSSSLNNIYLKPISFKLDCYNYTGIRVIELQYTFDMPHTFFFQHDRNHPNKKYLTFLDPSDPIIDELTYFRAGFHQPGMLFFTYGAEGKETYLHEENLSFNEHAELTLDGKADAWFVCTWQVPGDQPWDKDVKPVPHNVRVLTASDISLEQDCVAVKIKKVSPA